MNAPATSALNGLLEPLSQCLDDESARRIVGFRVDAATQARMDYLAERANEGTLTEEERDEYSSLIDAGDLIAILQLKARRRLERGR